MSGATKKLFDGEEVAEVLSGTYYKARAVPLDKARAVPLDKTRAVPLDKGGAVEKSQARADAADEERPAHYKVICISLYNEDLARLDGMVEELKRRGFTKANRSALIRFALEQADLDKVKKGM